MTALQRFGAPTDASFHARVGELAAFCLKLEASTYPKPGLVSHVDNGSHHDMDFGFFCAVPTRSRPFSPISLMRAPAAPAWSACGRSGSRPNAPC